MNQPIMRNREWSLLVLLHCSLTTSLHPLAIRRHAPSRVVCKEGLGDLETVVAEQAQQIAELRRMVETMQQARADVPAASFVASPTRTPRATRPPKTAGTKGPVYKLFGKLPEGYDSTAATGLIAKRVTARLKKHYSEADRLQKRLLRMGIKLDDRRRTYSITPDWKEMQERLEEEDQRSWRQQQQMQQELEQRIKDIFAYWDQNGNGLVDRTEFALAIQVLGMPGTAEEYDRMFDEWDVDDSGALNFKEVRGALMELQKSQPHVLENAHMTVQLLS